MCIDNSTMLFYRKAYKCLNNGDFRHMTRDLDVARIMTPEISRHCWMLSQQVMRLFRLLCSSPITSRTNLKATVDE
jgi:hypothetical protein